MFSFLFELLRKNVFKIVLIVLMLLSLGFAWTMYKKALEAINQRDSARAEMQTKTGQIETYENERGQSVTRLLQYEKYIGDLEFSIDSMEVELHKTIKSSRTKEKRIREATVVYVKAKNSGPILADSSRADSVGVINEEIGRVFNDGFLNALIFSDSLFYQYDEQIVLIKAQREVDRKFFLWRWLKWKKKINRDLIEISSSNPSSKLNGRFIKLE